MVAKQYQRISVQYIIVVLGLTWLCTYLLFLNNDIGIVFYPVLMFIPGIVAVFCRIRLRNTYKTEYNIPIFPSQTKGLLFSVLFPILCILVNIFVVFQLELGIIYMDKIKLLRWGIPLLVVGFIGAFGEEYGWRGFLLPILETYIQRHVAIFIVGVVWGLFHLPMVYFLSVSTGIASPVWMCSVQFLSCIFFSFPFAFSYHLSKSVFAPALLHTVWNTYNSLWFGNIYTNEPGIIKGNIFLLSGEGILGLITSVVFALFFLIFYKQSNRLNDL